MRRGGNEGSHVLAYADRPGGTEEHALYGTPEEIRAKLDELRQAGVEYVLLTFSGGVAQLHRFACEVMPSFSRLADAAAGGRMIGAANVGVT